MLRNKKSCELAIHYNKTPHDLKDFSFTVIEGMQNTTRDLEETLLTREGYWAAQLSILQPFGLNKRCKFRSKNVLIINANDVDLLDKKVPIVIIVIFSFCSYYN